MILNRISLSQIIIHLSCATWAVAEVVHVDPREGDDAHDGMSEQQAVRTLSRARDVVRTIVPVKEEGVEVRLHDGVHVLAEPLVLDARDGGRDGWAVRYRAAEGAMPVISGGTVLNHWKLHDPAANIWKHDYDGIRFRELYVKGRIAIRAREPDIRSKVNRGPYFKTQFALENKDGYRVWARDLAGLGDLTNVEMVVQPHWYHNRLFIAAVEFEQDDAIIRFDAANVALAFAKKSDYYIGNAYHLEGAYKFVDTEGEWFLDESGQVVYYKPEAGMSPLDTEIVAGRLEVLVDVVGTPEAPVKALSFEGLGFAHTDWYPFVNNLLVATQAVQRQPLTVRAGNENPPPAALRVRFAEGVVVKNCRFSALAANGLQGVRGVKSSVIKSSVFTDIGGNAINLDAWACVEQSAADRTEHILVSDNVLQRFGQIYNGVGILASFVADTVMEHNEISDGPYIGIQLGNQSLARADVGMRNNVIRHNIVQRVMRLQDDGGAIYTLGPQPHSQITQNVIRDVRKGPWAMSAPLAGIYLDNDSEHFAVTDNVLIDVQVPVYLQLNKGTKNNLLRANDNVPLESIVSKAGPQGGKQ